MHRYLLVLWALSLVVPFAHADLRSSMSADEFEAAGLHKLTAAELATLEAWIERGGQPPVPAVAPTVSADAAPVTAAPVAPAPVVPAAAQTPVEPAASPEARFGQEQVEKPRAPDIPDSISARIVGEFRGWDGNTIFRLDNGQVWQQRVGGKYRSPRRNDPEVVVEKGRFGYYLKIIETSRTVGVKRLR